MVINRLDSGGMCVGGRGKSVFKFATFCGRYDVVARLRGADTTTEKYLLSRQKTADKRMERRPVMNGIRPFVSGCEEKSEQKSDNIGIDKACRIKNKLDGLGNRTDEFTEFI